jgi:hypothetical protein
VLAGVRVGGEINRFRTESRSGLLRVRTIVFGFKKKRRGIWWSGELLSAFQEWFCLMNWIKVIWKRKCYELWWSDWNLLLQLFGGVQEASKTYGWVYKMDSRRESFDTSCSALLSAASGTLWRKRVECRVSWSAARADSVSVICYGMFSKPFSLTLAFHSSRIRVAYVTFFHSYRSCFTRKEICSTYKQRNLLRHNDLIPLIMIFWVKKNCVPLITIVACLQKT